MWLVHNYLFIKIPLLRLIAFSTACQNYAAFASRGARFITYGLGIYGVFSPSEWETSPRNLIISLTFKA